MVALGCEYEEKNIIGRSMNVNLSETGQFLSNKFSLGLSALKKALCLIC